MPDVVERLKRDFRDPDYRHIYDEGFLNSSIATQIKVLREQREWTQARLAGEARMNQSRISEMEDVNFYSWTIRILRRLARAFDLRLVISFEEFGTLLHDFRNLNRQQLSRRSFAADPSFQTEEAPLDQTEESPLGSAVSTQSDNRTPGRDPIPINRPKPKPPAAEDILNAYGTSDAQRQVAAP